MLRLLKSSRVFFYQRLKIKRLPYTHLGMEDAKDEMIRMEELNAAKKELEKTIGEKPVTQKIFRVV